MPGLGREEEIGMGRERGLRSFWQSAIQSHRFERTARRKARLKLMLKALSSFKERRDRAFSALRSRLEKSLGEERDSLYGEELFDSSEPYNTTEVSARAVQDARMREPSNNALFAVFQGLSDDDYNRDGSVKVSVINDVLEDRGYGRADKDMIDDAYSEWSLEQSQEQGTKKAASKKRTRKRSATKKAGKTSTKGE